MVFMLIFYLYVIERTTTTISVWKLSDLKQQLWINFHLGFDKSCMKKKFIGS